MPMPALRTTLITGGAKIDREKRGVVFRAAFGTFPPAIKEPARIDAAKDKVGEQRHRADEIGEDPDLERDGPTGRPQSKGVRAHKKNRKIAEPVKRRRPGDSE